MNNERRNKIVTLKEGQTIYLMGQPFLKLVGSNEPLLKATIELTPLGDDDKTYVYHYNFDDWVEVEPGCLIVGLGDKVTVGRIEMLVTSHSKRYGEVRFSMRSTDHKTSVILAESTWG